MNSAARLAIFGSDLNDKRDPNERLMYIGVPDALPVPITEAEHGDWKINTFTLTHEQLALDTLRRVRDGQMQMRCKPGTYTRLVHKKRGVVMSNTPMEVLTNRAFISKAKGKVLINGLGLGMVLRAVLDKPEVESVVVHEVDGSVITMVMPGFEREILDGRLSIHHIDCTTYKPAKGERYDVIWHDIWDEISDDNLGQMAMLKRKWAKRCEWQGCWSQEMARDLKRKWRR